VSYLIIYLLGVVIAAFVLFKRFPDDNDAEFVRIVTVIWPFVLFVLVMLLPLILAIRFGKYLASKV
jgi:hypothetical protein